LEQYYQRKFNLQNRTIEFYELTGATPPLALQKAKPKSKCEIAKAEKFEREALALLTPEQRTIPLFSRFQ
jgi:hypothetical protein